MFVSKFSSDIKLSVCICNASSSGVVRRLAYLPSHSEGSRSPPAFPHHLHHHRLPRFNFPYFFGFGRSSISRSRCHGEFRPIFRIYHQDPASSVSSSVLYVISKLEGGVWKKFSTKDYESLPGLEPRRLS